MMSVVREHILNCSWRRVAMGGEPAPMVIKALHNNGLTFVVAKSIFSLGGINDKDTRGATMRVVQNHVVSNLQQQNHIRPHQALDMRPLVLEALLRNGT